MGKYFNFRIVKVDNGMEVIDQTRITPVKALTPLMLAEYEEVATNLYIADRKKKQAERRKKIEWNLLYKLLFACGIV